MLSLTLDALTSPLADFLATADLVPTAQGLGRIGNVDFYYHSPSKRWCCVHYFGPDRSGTTTYHDRLCFITLPMDVNIPFLDEVRIAYSGSRRLWLIDPEDLLDLRTRTYGSLIDVLGMTE